MAERLRPDGINSLIVIAGLDPAIHANQPLAAGIDARITSGHDGSWAIPV